MAGNIEKINISIGDTSLSVEKGVSLMELSRLIKSEVSLDILAAKVNNKVRDLNFKILDDSDIEFIDITKTDGLLVYKRSLFLLMLKASQDLFPDKKLNIRHSLSRGTYCELNGTKTLEETDVKQLEDRMRQLARGKFPLIRRVVTIDEARNIFKEKGDTDRLRLLKYYDKETLSIYSLEDMTSYLYGYLVPDTGYLRSFELKYYNQGFILRYPDNYSPFEIPDYEENSKLFNVINEYKNWGEILGVADVSSLNEHISSGQSGDLIRVSEAFHEKKIVYIADIIKSKASQLKIVLISGPSSSGKTTFAERLAIHLRVNGLKPLTISLDDYFVERRYTPIDENGEPDFEALEAIDTTLFNEHLNLLISGEEVEVPKYNFNTGKRDSLGKRMKMASNGIIIIEGIHGLNEKLTYAIPRKNKFKIYISALTQLSKDYGTPISTTDTRLIRRMVRDYKFRSNPPIETLKMWHSVRRGEMKNIFPFQEQADVMFNSALVYELSVLKQYALPLLENIEEEHEQYSEARRLISFLSFFVPVGVEEIPGTSIIREFVGGSQL